MEKEQKKYRGWYNKQVKDGKQRQTWAYHAKKFRKEKCESCNTTKRLQIHHKDRNWANNDPLNLMTLCGTCHMELHHREGDILPEYTYQPCRICGAPYVKNSRGDLCSTHRANLLKRGIEVIPKVENPPCRICAAPYKPGMSRGDLCGKCRKTNKTTKKKCPTCDAKIWPGKEYCYRHTKF